MKVSFLYKLFSGSKASTVVSAGDIKKVKMVATLACLKLATFSHICLAYKQGVGLCGCHLDFYFTTLENIPGQMII